MNITAYTRFHAAISITNGYSGKHPPRYCTLFMPVPHIRPVYCSISAPLTKRRTRDPSVRVIEPKVHRGYSSAAMK
jgi:hypothetical protein